MSRVKKQGRNTEEEKTEPVVVNGWTLYAHPLILDQIERLALAVEKTRDTQCAPAKVLKWIYQDLFEVIPQDPTRTTYRQGNALGKENTGWFRSKYAGQFRLFFRYNLSAKVIIYAWVNDEQTLRAYDSKSDAYLVFKGMLDDGNPPGDWAELLKLCSDPEILKRLKGKLKR